MTGTLLSAGTHASIRLERSLPDSPQEVWASITDREDLKKWFPCDVIVHGTWTPGASITFEFPKDVIDITLTGEVLEVEEPYRLVYTWGEETLRFEIIPDGSGSRLVLIDELRPSIAARNAAGWDECLDKLRDTGVAQVPWKTRFAKYAEMFEAELGPQEGPPAGYKGDPAA